MRHSQVKLRKALGERGTELEHTRRRAEQYQDEVRKLRGRVEELKHDLAAAEDEVSWTLLCPYVLHLKFFYNYEA